MSVNAVSCCLEALLFASLAARASFAGLASLLQLGPAVQTWGEEDNDAVITVA